MPGISNASSSGTRNGFRPGLALLMRSAGRGALVSLALVLVALFGATAATAYWQSTGTGTATAATATLAPPTNVVVPSASESAVAVTWTGSAGQLAPTGYFATRSTGTITTAACGSSPAEPMAGTSCTDFGVPDGNYTYVITAVYASWTASSAASGAVAVAGDRAVFVAQPTNVTAGESLIPAVGLALETPEGMAIAIANIPVTLGIGNNPGAGTLTGTLTALTDASGVATLPGLSINKAGVGYTLIATSPGLTSATSQAFNVTPAAASKIVYTGAAVSGAASATATVGPFTVQRQDAYGNPVTTGSASLALSTNSAGTAVFSTVSGGAAVTGVTIPDGSSTASFFYGDTKAASPSITVTSTGLTPAAGTATVTAAVASKLQFGQQPTATVKNQPITPAVTVLIIDQFGNLTASTAPVTIAKTTQQGHLSGTLVKTAIGGVATFSDLSINPSGSFSLIATSGTLTSATSVAFTIG